MARSSREARRAKRERSRRCRPGGGVSLEDGNDKGVGGDPVNVGTGDATGAAAEASSATGVTMGPGGTDTGALESGAAYIYR